MSEPLAQNCADKLSAENWRMLSSISYIVILICFGVPIWWHTTKVYRASLPLEEMMELSSSPPEALRVDIICASGVQRAHLLSEELRMLLGDTVIPTACDEHPKLPTNSDMADVNYATDVFIKSRVKRSQQALLIFVEWVDAPLDFILTEKNVIYFKEGLSAYRLAAFLEKWPGVDFKTALFDPKKDYTLGLRERPLPAGPRYDVLITVVNPQPQSPKIQWDVVGSIQEYMEPYIREISPVANLTVKSQWLYLVDLGVNLKKVGDHWMLAEQLLPHIITPLEKKLSSLVSKDPCINLVIYIPPCDTAPIHIYNQAGNRSPAVIDAFISPRWGGVIIANPNCKDAVFKPDSKLIFSTLTTLLSKILGMPNFKSTFGESVLQSGKQPAEWQINYIMRAHTLEYIESAKLTLRSLSQLLLEISNIVINDDIAEAVKLALTNTAKANEFLKSSNYSEAFLAAQIAALSAEAAFVDPSLLTLLYFPDDQKYAVYIPLFLPIMIPVFMSVGNLMKRLKNSFV